MYNIKKASIETSIPGDGAFPIEYEELLQAFNNQTIIKGYIKDRNKGEMDVDLMGLKAFLPGSHLDVKPIKDYESYIGRFIDLKVLSITRYSNIIVSHRAIIEDELEQHKNKILSKLEKGEVLEGTVKNLTSFGVF